MSAQPAAPVDGPRPDADLPVDPGAAAALRPRPGSEEARLREALARVERELEETNRGVVAVYAELEDTAEELRRASLVKSRFLSSVSHEFRTPLGSISALTRLLLDSGLDAEQQRQVSFIAEAARDLTTLVDDLLDLARVEAGRIIVHPRVFLPGDFLANLVELVRPLARPGVEIRLGPQDGLPLVESDSLRLGQIVRNFLSNALKFTSSGHVAVAARVAPGLAIPAAALLDARTPQAAETGDFLVISVTDTGIGIAPADLERIFEEFVQVEGLHQAPVKGTGLGLPLARGLAALLGGGVWVTSGQGEGSTFSVAIPLTVVGTPAATAVPAEVELPALAWRSRQVDAPGWQPPAGAAGPTGAILVADDNDAMRYVLVEALTPTGRPVKAFAGGVPVLAAARGLQPALIVLDLEMADMHGLDVLARLREDPATTAIPVVIHTAVDLDEAARASLEGRVSAIVPKGGSVDALLAAVAAALEGARS